VSPLINDADKIRGLSKSQDVPLLYLPNRFREVLEYLERQNHWKFLQNGLA
jgi:hypothetical protein